MNVNFVVYAVLENAIFFVYGGHKNDIFCIWGYQKCIFLVYGGLGNAMSFYIRVSKMTFCCM